MSSAYNVRVIHQYGSLCDVGLRIRREVHYAFAYRVSTCLRNDDRCTHRRVPLLSSSYVTINAEQVPTRFADDCCCLGTVRIFCSLQTRGAGRRFVNCRHDGCADVLKDKSIHTSVPLADVRGSLERLNLSPPPITYRAPENISPSHVTVTIAHFDPCRVSTTSTYYLGVGGRQGTAKNTSYRLNTCIVDYLYVIYISV